MQAESLANDLDLAYTRQDFHRAVLARHGEPPDLELASGSGGRRITYDRPFAYALWMAPFLRVWPEKGFAVANFLLFVFCRTLRRRGAGSRDRVDGAVLGRGLPFLVGRVELRPGWPQEICSFLPSSSSP